MKNKKILYLILIIVIFIIGVLVYFLMGDSSSNYEETLLLTCSKYEEDPSLKVNLYIDAYQKGEELKIIQSTEFDIIKTLSATEKNNLLEIMKDSLYNKQKAMLDLEFGENYKYITTSSQIIGDKLKTDITLIINENSAANIYKAFEYNFLGATKQEIAKYFEEEGFICDIK